MRILGPELCGLLSRTLREIRAANPFRKTQIILNPRTSAGLAADGEAFDKMVFRPSEAPYTEALPDRPCRPKQGEGAPGDAS